MKSSRMEGRVERRLSGGDNIQLTKLINGKRARQRTKSLENVINWLQTSGSIGYICTHQPPIFAFHLDCISITK